MSKKLVLLLAASLGPAPGQEAPAGDRPAHLLPGDSAAAFRLNGTAGEFAKMSTAAVTGQPFSNALRINVTKTPQRPADVQIAAPVDAAMAAGDVLMVSFWLRSVTPGEATIDAGFRASSAGFRGPPPLNMPAVAGTEWKKIQLPFALARAATL